MTKEQVWAVAWIFLAAWFIVWEGLAFVLRRPDLTLSDFTWRLEGAGWTFGRYVVAAFLLWAFLHLVFGWLR